jgi:6-phosphogluconolactonase
VSNRGHDSLAVFSIDPTSGALQRIAVTGTQGEIPRNFGISPDGRWLVVANQDSHSLVSFRRDPATGLLDAVDKVDSPSPAFIAFFD